MARALSDFERAFAEARAKGLKTFEFSGRLFTTETKEDQQRRAREVTDSIPKSASQLDLRNTTAGRTMSTIGSELRKPTNAMNLLRGIQASAADILQGSESRIAQNVPELGAVKSSFEQANREGKAKGLDLVEQDVYRHKAGSRNSAIDNGFFATLLGSQGHEANTLMATAQGVLKGKEYKDISPTGQVLTPGRYGAESVQDMINNFLGMAEAIGVQLGIGSRDNPPDFGSISIDRPGTSGEKIGSSVEQGINKLAEVTRHLQDRLAAVKENVDAKS